MMCPLKYLIIKVFENSATLPSLLILQTGYRYGDIMDLFQG